MLTISRHGNGFKIKVSAPGMGWRSYSVYVADLRDVHNAVSHYYQEGGTVANHQLHPIPSVCPFCRRSEEQERQEETKAKKKTRRATSKGA